MVGLGSAGLVAGVSLPVLQRCRARQLRHRHPGRTVASCPPELVGMEKSLRLAGPAGQRIVDALDYCLRLLAEDFTDSGSPFPDIMGARVTSETIDLFLATGSQPGPPAQERGQVDIASGQWHLPREESVDEQVLTRLRDTAFVAYPALVSIGTTGAGGTEHWMLDLEVARVVTLSGDREGCRSLARCMVVELAHNPMSQTVDVILVGLTPELRDLGPHRITSTSDAREPVVSFHRDLRYNLDTMRAGGITDVLQERSRSAAEGWEPRILIVDPDVIAAGPESSETLQSLKDLCAALCAAPGRAGLVVVLTGDLPVTDDDIVTASVPGTRVFLDAQGQASVPELGLTCAAAHLPAPTATHLVSLFNAADDLRDQPAPPARGQSPWDLLTDTLGAPRTELTARTERTCGRSVLEQIEILDRTASTSRDIDVLAPSLSDDIAQRITEADPGLDGDLTAWRSLGTHRARLSLLGPVRVHAHGRVMPEGGDQAWYTEVVAYLAAHPRGVTTAQFSADLRPGRRVSPSEVHHVMDLVRQWLGVDSRTGRPHVLPTDADGAGGPDLCQVAGLLTDADLFRRLRLRGVSRGPQGISDLQAALDLVSGTVLEQRRPGGYTWLLDVPLDTECTAMIVDVAHLVATHHLSAGHPDRAAAAARVSLTAGSQDDIPILDLTAASEDLSRYVETLTWIRRIYTPDDPQREEEDLPDRTAQIMLRRHWKE